MTGPDAFVVGSGPNGLAAAITLARAGRSVVVLEANDTLGGAVRTQELTGPGFRHDVGSAIHPLGRASPFFRSLDLESHGVEWIDPPAAVAHPLDGGRAAMVWKDFDRTIDELGPDGAAYRRYFSDWVDRFESLTELALQPVFRRPAKPFFAAKFGAAGFVPATITARTMWTKDAARAIYAGHAAHSVLPLGVPLTSSFAILLGSAAHAVGWPFPRGGAQAITDALVSILTELGGQVRTGVRVDSLAELADARAVIFSIGPHDVARIVDGHFPDRFSAALERFRYGPGAWKVDFALSDPIPWVNPAVAEAGTVHVGGSFEEVVVAEAEVGRGRHPRKPFVLLAQQTIHDPSRAPAGRHTAWAYCHVPNGSNVDRTEAIVDQIERFAPGFRETIIDRFVSSPAILERQNRAVVGGDVAGGSHAGRQLLFRPTIKRHPFDTPDPRLFIGSASTTPGGGVHGMGGLGAAQRALATVLS